MTDDTKFLKRKWILPMIYKNLVCRPSPDCILTKFEFLKVSEAALHRPSMCSVWFLTKVFNPHWLKRRAAQFVAQITKEKLSQKYIKRGKARTGHTIRAEAEQRLEYCGAGERKVILIVGCCTLYLYCLTIRQWLSSHYSNQHCSVVSMSYRHPHHLYRHSA